jgi:hypothetical protein
MEPVEEQMHMYAVNSIPAVVSLVGVVAVPVSVILDVKLPPVLVVTAARHRQTALLCPAAVHHLVLIQVLYRAAPLRRPQATQPSPHNRLPAMCRALHHHSPRATRPQPPKAEQYPQTPAAVEATATFAHRDNVAHHGAGAEPAIPTVAQAVRPSSELAPAAATVE